MYGKASEDEFKIFAHNVAKLRQDHGISKKEMAGLLGIGIESLNKIESGEFPPRLKISVFFEIQKHFGVSPGNLLKQRLN